MRCSQLNEYMNFYEYQSDSDSTFSSFFSLETARLIEANFMLSLHGMWNEREYTNGLCHMAAIHIYGKNLKNLLLWNQKAD